MIIHLIVIEIKEISLYEISYFPEPYSRNKSKIEVDLNLSNYATKSNLKNTASPDTSNFAKKVDLASSKSDVEKLDIDKLKTTPVDFGKLSNVKVMLLKSLCKINWLKKLMRKTNDTSNLVKKVTTLQIM